jgi:hypothetical protein
MYKWLNYNYERQLMICYCYKTFGKDEPEGEII